MSLNKVVTEKFFFLVKFQGFFDPIAGTDATSEEKIAAFFKLKI